MTPLNTPKVHYPFLDGLRGLAILLVFFYHVGCDVFGSYSVKWNGLWRDFSCSSGWLLFPVSIGWLGVAVFFVVSGFCIQLTISNKNSINWAEFFTRRILRVYPPYLIALVLFCTIFPFFGWSALPKLRDVMSHLLLIQNIIKGSFMAINPSMWSIAIEIQLYLIFPIFCFLVSRLNWKGAMLLVGGLEVALRASQSVALCKNISGIYWPLTGFTPIYWCSWALGAYAVRAVTLGRKSPPLRAFACILAGLFANYFKPIESFSFLLIAMGTADCLVLYSSISAPQWVNYIGRISYSFYLLHQPIIGVLGKLVRQYSMLSSVPAFQFAILSIVSFVIIFPVSIFFYRMIELPCHEVARTAYRRLMAKYIAVN